MFQVFGNVLQESLQHQYLPASSFGRQHLNKQTRHTPINYLLKPAVPAIYNCVYIYTFNTNVQIKYISNSYCDVCSTSLQQLYNESLDNHVQTHQNTEPFIEQKAAYLLQQSTRERCVIIQLIYYTGHRNLHFPGRLLFDYSTKQEYLQLAADFLSPVQTFAKTGSLLWHNEQVTY